MEELIQSINEITTGSAVIIGEWARKYNGFIDNPPSDVIFISIPPSSVYSIQNLGNVIATIGQNNWGTMVENQIVIATPTNQIIEVYVTNSTPTYNIISGSKVQTPAYELQWHQQAYTLFSTEYLNLKIQELQSLYNL